MRGYMDKFLPQLIVYDTLLIVMTIWCIPIVVGLLQRSNREWRKIDFMLWFAYKFCPKAIPITLVIAIIGCLLVYFTMR